MLTSLVAAIRLVSLSPRLAHVDMEGLVMDSKVHSLRDRFVLYEWS